MNTKQVQELNFFVDSLEASHKKNHALLIRLVDWIMQSDYQSISDAYQAIKSTKYSVQGYMESLDIVSDIKGRVYDAGYASALIDLAKLYGDRSSAFAEISGIKTSYKDEILSILLERGILLHKELAGELGISKSQLNATIKLMNSSSVKLINAEEVSKYKLYSLTPIAYKYVKEKKNGLSQATDTGKRTRENVYYFMLGVKTGMSQWYGDENENIFRQVGKSVESTICNNYYETNSSQYNYNNKGFFKTNHYR